MASSTKVWLTGGVIALALAGCSTPSQKYGLPPPAEIEGEYPNINLDPAAKPEQQRMSPAEREAAEAELKRRAKGR